MSLSFSVPGFLSLKCLKSDVTINGWKVVGVAYSSHSDVLYLVMKQDPKIGVSKKKKEKRLDPLHLHKSLTVTRTQTCSRDPPLCKVSVNPWCYSTAWQIQHLLPHDLALPSHRVCTIGGALTQSPISLTISVYSRNLHVGGPDTFQGPPMTRALGRIQPC